MPGGGNDGAILAPQLPDQGATDESCATENGDPAEGRRCLFVGLFGACRLALFCHGVAFLLG